MVNKPIYLIIELTVLFLMIPLSLILDISPIIKVGLVLMGTVYCIRVSIKQNLFSRRVLFAIQFKNNWKIIVLKFLLMAIGSSIAMYYLNQENLFIVVRNNPLLWVAVSLFYTLFSVLPQEFLYRSFFFQRYERVFNNTTVLIGVNAVLFSIAHLVFQNFLVSILTLLGGVVLAMTYYKCKSLMLTSIEHSIYGIWLFTVGMGEMLAFPTP